MRSLNGVSHCCTRLKGQSTLHVVHTPQACICATVQPPCTSCLRLCWPFQGRSYTVSLIICGCFPNRDFPCYPICGFSPCLTLRQFPHPLYPTAVLLPHQLPPHPSVLPNPGLCQKPTCTACGLALAGGIDVPQ